jgi:hypothetical protein
MLVEQLQYYGMDFHEILYWGKVKANFYLYLVKTPRHEDVWEVEV